jgi:hypothetical protein
MTVEQIKTKLNTITKFPKELRLNAWTLITDVPHCIDVCICRAENGCDVSKDQLEEIIKKLKDNLD